MTTLSTSLVNTGLSPNDGTGDSLRAAFVATNDNVTAIQTFLTQTPEFTEANVELLNAETLDANVANITSLTATTTTVTGNLQVNGNILGKLTGNVTSTTALIGNLTVSGTTLTYGDAIFGGNSTGITGNLTVSKDVEITGNLLVNGNVTSVTRSELIIQHPTIELSSTPGASLSSNDGNDRGIEFYWYDSQERKGFFGFDNSSQKLVFIPRATQVPEDGGNVEQFSGTLGTALFDTVEANVSSTGTSVFNAITGTSSNIVNMTGNLVTARQANITSLGTLANLQVTGGNVDVSTGNINITGPAGTTLRINGVQVSTVDANFTGGAVPNATTFNANTTSTSTSTGTVILSGVGGLGIGGNLHAGNITTAGALSAGSFSAANLGGTLTTAHQPNVTSLGTLANLTVSTTISGSVSGSAATVTSATQSAITSVGTLTSITTSGNINATGGGTVFNLGSSVGGATPRQTITINNDGYAVPSDAALTSVGDKFVAWNASNMKGAIGLSAGTMWYQSTGSVSAGHQFYTGSTATPVLALTIANTGLVTAVANVAAPVFVGNLAGTVTTAAQPSITSLGTLTSALVAGNVTVGGTLKSSAVGDIGESGARFGTVYSTTINNSGTVTSAILTASTGNINISTVGKGLRFADGTFQTTSAGGYVEQANVAVKVTAIADNSTNATNYPFFGNVTTGNTEPRTDNGFTYNPSTGNLTSLIFTGALYGNANTATSAGSATSATNATNTAITDDVATAVPVYPTWVSTASGNQAQKVSSSKMSFVPSTGVLTVIATSAQYADLAERYESDQQYEPGTVLIFGGPKEVTVTSYKADISVAGAVSTDPAYLMNNAAPNSVAVALRGKVPVKVYGPVKKGDLLVTSSMSGHAESVGREASYGVAIFAKSLEENLSVGTKVINAVIL